MNKILLIQPPIHDFYFTAKRSIPYGLISIASVLREYGFHVELADGLATSKSRVIETPLEMSYLDDFYGQEDYSPFALFHKYRHYGYSFEHMGNLAKKSGAFLVGISSLFSAYSDEALETARVVKKNHPNCKIVMGGHHPTALPESVMKEPAVDYVIRGEGEVVFPNLAMALQKGEPVDSIKGLVYRKKGGALNQATPLLMDDPDTYPLPATDLVNHRFYRRKNGGSSVITASRGCPMKCSYCCVSASGSTTYRRRSVESVFSEIEASVLHHNARFIDFEDENMTLSKSWFLKLLDKIRSNFGHLNLELRAMNGLFPPSLDEEMILKMKETGFKTLNLSLCTTSKLQLKRFNRPDVQAAVERVVSYAKKYHMDAVCYVIVGSPGQQAFDSVADLVYLAGLDAIGGVSVFYPAPGSLDFHRLKGKKLIPEKNSLLRSSAIPISDTTTRLESVTLLRLGRIINFMKTLRKDGVHIKPIPFDISAEQNPNDRHGTGIQFLQAFLSDAEVRGITASGDVYCHAISKSMTEKFLEELRNSSITGCQL